MDSGLDLDGNLEMDMVYSTDNYGAVILDHNNVAHVFYGAMRYTDDDLFDGNDDLFSSEIGDKKQARRKKGRGSKKAKY